MSSIFSDTQNYQTTRFSLIPSKTQRPTGLSTITTNLPITSTLASSSTIPTPFGKTQTYQTTIFSSTTETKFSTSSFSVSISTKSRSDSLTSDLPSKTKTVLTN